MSCIVGVLNQPFVKENFKRGSGLVTCMLGVAALYSIYTGPTARRTPESTADKVTRVFTQVSMILSATVTPLGVWAISRLVNPVFSSSQLETVFGPNTIFASNWTHPRHIVSLAAAGLTIALIAKRWFVKEKPTWEGCALYWTAVTSRPTLHLGNQLAHGILSRLK